MAAAFTTADTTTITEDTTITITLDIPAFIFPTATTTPADDTIIDLTTAGLTDTDPITVGIIMGTETLFNIALADIAAVAGRSGSISSKPEVTWLWPRKSLTLARNIGQVFFVVRATKRQ